MVRLKGVGAGQGISHCIQPTYIYRYIELKYVATCRYKQQKAIVD